jgi:hypothetical protein
MVNKIRKIGGSFRYPYQAVLPFVQVQSLMDELKDIPGMNHVYRDNVSYGAKLWGGTLVNIPYDPIISTFRKYIPDFDTSQSYIWESEYHGRSLHFEIYIAYTEFDKEV